MSERETYLNREKKISDILSRLPPSPTPQQVAEELYTLVSQQPLLTESAQPLNSSASEHELPSDSANRQESSQLKAVEAAFAFKEFYNELDQIEQILLNDENNRKPPMGFPGTRSNSNSQSTDIPTTTALPIKYYFDRSLAIRGKLVTIHNQAVDSTTNMHFQNCFKETMALIEKMVEHKIDPGLVWQYFSIRSQAQHSTPPKTEYI